MSKIVLSAKNISKSFSDPAPLELLQDISLDVASGETLAILGKSGEGKTTLLHILGTLDEPTTGTIELLGSPVLSQNRNILRNRHIGFVFQAFHLLDDISVIDNILMPLYIARQKIDKDSENYENAILLLEKLGLYERRNLSALKLSGGEKQRLAIGRAFITNPDIILADEPTGNLDHQTAQEIQNLLFSWAEEQNKSLLVVTHSLDLAKRTSSRYQLESGRLILQ